MISSLQNISIRKICPRKSFACDGKPAAKFINTEFLLRVKIITGYWKYNLGQKICRLFNFFQFLFTTCETELDYYHQKVNILVASRVAKRLKTYDLMKLRNLKKIPEMLGFDSDYPAVHAKAKC